jgi:hypothetical protein
MESDRQRSVLEMSGQRLPSMSTCPYRHDITVPPRFMEKLPVDRRGYPVPWFVQWLNGEPEFRAMDLRKFRLAIDERRCWTCGHQLFREEVFVIGPMCSVNRISSEPASHRECAVYAAKNCPFLSKPHMVRREDGLIDKQQSAGVMSPRNPGVILLWYTYRHELLEIRKPKMGGEGFLFKLGRPFKLEWYCRGRFATREEALESFESGLALLRETAAINDGPEGVEQCEREIAEARRYIPR